MDKQLLIMLHEAGKISLTTAMVSALTKNTGVEFKRICQSCGFVVPKYKGAYSKICPVCAKEFNNETKEILATESLTGIQYGVITTEAKLSEFDDLKSFILKTVSITGKDDKTDPDELEAMADIRDNVHDYKTLIKTLKKEYHFDKKDLKNLESVIIDFQFN